VVRGENVTIRPVTAADLDLLASWFADLDFVRWWGGVPKIRSEVADAYFGDDPALQPFVVEDGGKPIGYVQAWSDEPPDGGIDIALVPEAQGRGLGVDAVSALARHLRETGWRRITVDPAANDARAIGAFEKAAFVREGTAGPHVILRFEPMHGLVGGPEPGTITIVEYDPAWPQRFEREARRIRQALGATATLVEHIGSTSVPGLAAKPIVDILVAVAEVADERSYRPALEGAGYILRVREPGHRMFRTPAKDVHVHLWDAMPQIERHVDFRERLRASRESRLLYERTKRELATRRWADVNEYADAKSAVIARILARAR
jgi:GrpB-like predicted nucleotidyltransferase (UPF0157 family)